MPIISHQTIQPEGELGIWRIEESESWFLHNLTLTEAEMRQLEKIKGRRRTEWLAARQLVHDMSGREHRGAFIKDEFGKPHLEGADWHISISHSKGLAAAIAAPLTVGVDIQHPVEKIERLAHRFLRPEELNSLDPHKRLEHLHVYWGAKEALYKAYGRRRLDFSANILINPFPYRKTSGTTTAKIAVEGYTGCYRIEYREIEGYYLVYAVEE